MLRLAAVLLLTSVIATPQSAGDAVRLVAGKILAQAAPHSAISLSMENRASLAPASADEVRQLLEQALRTGGLDIADNSEAKLRAYISENTAGYLLIAQWGATTAMAGWIEAAGGVTPYGMRIQRTILRQQREPILDVLLLEKGAMMVVLEPEHVLEYRKKAGEWQIERAVSLPLASPMPRDPRGRMDPSAAGIAISVPGTECRGTTTPVLQVTCEGGDTRHWASRRNYFETPEQGRFYTSAETPEGTLVAGVDGHTRLYAQRKEPARVAANWGSDIVAAASQCGSGRQVLAGSPAAGSGQEYVQAFEIVNGAATPVSEPLFLPGPITALWPGESAGEVTLVVRNQRTGMYEASRAGIACSE